MKKLAIFTFVLFLVAIVFTLFRSERSEDSEMRPLIQRDGEPIEAAERESGKQSLREALKTSVASKATGVNGMGGLERKHFEELVAEWVTESYSKNVILTQRRNRSLLGYRFEWLDRSLLPDDVIQHIKEQIPPLSSDESFLTESEEGEKRIVEPLTKENALSHVGHSLSMAFPPIKGMEIDGYFLFSGGTTTWAVYDFSTGIAVDPNTGKFYFWESVEELNTQQDLE